MMIMYTNLLVLIRLVFFPSVVYLCHYQVNEINGTIIYSSYENNVQCTWIFNLSSIANRVYFRSLLITFRQFDTEFGHDELFIGETISDVSRYNSKLHRFSGPKIPDPCFIPLRGDILTRTIWMQFTSDHTNTGLGFILDYVFQFNQTTIIPSKFKPILIDVDIPHPIESKSKNSKVIYPYPYGTISSPNYPQNYSNNIICRWHIFQRHAFIRLYIDQFNTESHYDTLTIQLGQNLNNRAMILYEWSGSNIDQRDLFISNDNFYLIFNTDKSNNASGFLLHYEIIEKEISMLDIYENEGIIHSKNYPEQLRTNMEYIWNIHMNNSNEIEINLVDIHLDLEHDCLQMITEEMIYSLTTPKLFRFFISNQTKLLLRTKHSHFDAEYRGFNLTYQKVNGMRSNKDVFSHSPCGQKYSSYNGTIEFSSEVLIALNCVILIEVDDGQNIFLRFDHLDWDPRENLMEIGLFHDSDQYQMFRISDALPGTWFIANDSQIWIRFSSSQYSLGISTFRLFYSETIQWSTVSPKPYVQILDDNRLFPYRLISLPTNGIYHNLTQEYTWHIKALDDESVQIIFQSLQIYDHRRLCFSIKDFFQTYEICSDRQFPYVHHHIGRCILSIEPEFGWILVQYDIEILKSKKITTLTELIFPGNDLLLALPMTTDPFVHIEWSIKLENSSSVLIFDIENFDGPTPAELIVPQNQNATKIYSLEKLSSTRFSHLLYTWTSPIRIIYKSSSIPIVNRTRLFRLHLYKTSTNYFHRGDFHYIFSGKKPTNFKWTIRGQAENSTFLANLYTRNKYFVLQTTANVGLSMRNSSTTISSSDFDIRYPPKRKSSDFLLILYEQPAIPSDQHIFLNKTSHLLHTTDSTSYNIQIHSTIFNSIDFIIIKADNSTAIRLYDFNSDTNGYLLLNSNVLATKGVSSSIGLRFSIQSLNIKLELQSLTKTPIEVRYKTRASSIPTPNSYHCFITDLNVCQNSNNQTCNNSCSHRFDYKSIPMNHTRIDDIWPYALRGSVTLIIENTTIENFEKEIFRKLRQSIAKIVRKFCFKAQGNCLSSDSDAIRADHVIVQSYDEQTDNHRLYVAIFIKDPYRRTIALTNEQFFLALKRNRQEIYQDIKHHVNLPTNISADNSLDPIWLYGVCVMALLVLLVVILMLLIILLKKTSRSTNSPNETKQKNDKNFVSSSIQISPVDDDTQNNSFCYHESESSETSNATLLAKLPPATTCQQYSTGHSSYFKSTIESAMQQHLDDEPIPFIDENPSTTHSRKSSACWSDRTSLSSRFSIIWKLNRMRSNSQNRPSISNSKDKRRARHRTIQYTISPSQANDQL